MIDMESIDRQIELRKQELMDALANQNDGKSRHLLKELAMLDHYKAEHPDDDHAPSSLELFCQDNPSAQECLIYED